jgi:hypothetical protein
MIIRNHFFTFNTALFPHPVEHISGAIFGSSVNEKKRYFFSISLQYLTFSTKFVANEKLNFKKNFKRHVFCFDQGKLTLAMKN